MRPFRARYVTACQQLLALGVVVVALAPAAGVVSLDVVGVEPDVRPTAPAVELRLPTPGIASAHPGGPPVRDVGSWKGRSYDGPG